MVPAGRKQAKLVEEGFLGGGIQRLKFLPLGVSHFALKQVTVITGNITGGTTQMICSNAPTSPLISSSCLTFATFAGLTEDVGLEG